MKNEIEADGEKRNQALRHRQAKKTTEEKINAMSQQQQYHSKLRHAANHPRTMVW